MARAYKKIKKIGIAAQVLCLAAVSAATQAAIGETDVAPSYAISDLFLPVRTAGTHTNSLDKPALFSSSSASPWVVPLLRVGMQVNLPTPTGVPPKTSFLIEHQQSESSSPGIPNGRQHFELQTWLKGKRILYAAEQDNSRIDINLRGSRVLAAMAERKVRGWSASLSQSLNPNWRLSAELAGSYRNKSEDPHTAPHLFLAASYAVNARMTFDAGIARRLSGETPDTTVFFAVSVPLELLHR